VSAEGWLRLDPRMLAVAPAQEVVKFIPLLIVAVLAGGGENREWWLLGALGAVVGLGMLRWVTTRYRVTHERMELHSGLLFRQHRSVPRDRIRTVDATAKLLHRIFGLTVLRIGTGQHEILRYVLTVHGHQHLTAVRQRHRHLQLPHPVPPHLDEGH
jgi:putative membrane protein